jgi:hypothetical protein
MNRMVRRIALCALVLLSSACSTVPFRSTEMVPAEPATAKELVDGLWDAGRGNFLIRSTAVFDFRGIRVPLTGVMKLDTARKSARLVGMNDMGVKLFDLAVDRTSSQPLFVVPDLARYPGFAEAVAASLRRIFLAPEPARDDALAIAPKSYRLTRFQDGAQLSFVLGGRHVQLLEKSARGLNDRWRVRYYEHQWQALRAIPRGIVLDDDMAGYRLTLWIESVEQTDE